MCGETQRRGGGGWRSRRGTGLPRGPGWAASARLHSLHGTSARAPERLLLSKHRFTLSDEWVQSQMRSPGCPSAASPHASYLRIYTPEQKRAFFRLHFGAFQKEHPTVPWLTLDPCTDPLSSEQGHTENYKAASQRTWFQPISKKKCAQRSLYFRQGRGTSRRAEETHATQLEVGEFLNTPSLTCSLLTLYFPPRQHR